MTRELWIALLTFLATIIGLATQMLPLPPDVVPWLIFLGAVINTALMIFFGVTGFRARAAARAAK